ncbi:hypothetical protein ABZV14_17620 [Streptosporangium canum]|uniref:hypothetical protein n=1 Tax=Streptosporangium canum TaxID=324952 RepID=UPI0033A23009
MSIDMSPRISDVLSALEELEPSGASEHDVFSGDFLTTGRPVATYNIAIPPNK